MVNKNYILVAQIAFIVNINLKMKVIIKMCNNLKFLINIFYSIIVIEKNKKIFKFTIFYFKLKN